MCVSAMPARKAVPVPAPGPGALPLLGRIVARNHRGIIFRKIAGLCRKYSSWYANVSYDLETNGEGRILDKLARFAPAVVFDAGANQGDWTAAAANRCTTAELHCFEISPSTFARLAARFAGNPRIHCCDAGLSDCEGFVTIRHYDGLDALTTASDYPHPFPFREIEARVITGSHYAEANGLRHIDMLKIDVEGMERPVLEGFAALFDRGAIDLVQFEYGRASIVNRVLLRDFYRFFEDHGFQVGKIYPHHVDFRPYDMGDEDFLGPNYLACRSARSDYLEVLGGR